MEIAEGLTRSEFIYRSGLLLAGASALVTVGCGGGSGTGRDLDRYPALKRYIDLFRDIPAGSFDMGSSSSGREDEQPVRRVTLSRFSFGATPVTAEMWREYCTAKGITMPDPPQWGAWLDGHPIGDVSWWDIMGFDGRGGYCGWASEVSGKHLTLPTEAQWEYAARGGWEGRDYPWGNSFDESKVWSSLNSDRWLTAPVDRTENIFENGYGLTDMVGHVWQWCLDWYGPYRSENETNPSGPAFGTARCLRGGGWGAYDDPAVFRCAQRVGDAPGVHSRIGGFRICSGSA